MRQGFLSEGSLCGRGLLELVARGSAIIAELLRLSEHIPGALIPGTTDPLQTKYHAVLFDFRWVGRVTCPCAVSSMWATAQRPAHAHCAIFCTA